MDMRNGDMYATREAAIQAGVPEESVGEVEVFIVRVTSGPFKGRIYRRTDHGLVRCQTWKHRKRCGAAGAEEKK